MSTAARSILIFVLVSFLSAAAIAQPHSVAREWNEVLLEAIRKDFARPTVHARNLFHTSAAMYDAWAAYSPTADPFLLGNTVGGYTCVFNGIPDPADVQAAREEAISFAAYRLLTHRFQNSPGVTNSLASFNDLMADLGYDTGFTSTDYSSGSPAALGNYIAECMIEFGFQDGANEQGAYANLFYQPVNPPLIPLLPGNPDIIDPNRWQPLTLEVFIDQSGNIIPGKTPTFLGPEWGSVVPFSLTADDLTIYNRDGYDYWVYHDPGAPPHIDINTGGGLSDEYKWSHSMVAVWSGHLDPTDGVMIDISPASFGNTPFDLLPRTFEEHRDFYDYLNGGSVMFGHALNPYTGQPYDPQIVPLGDYARVLAEFWADGPASETPPGHWFTILNYVNDHPLFEKRFMGTGDVLDDLEWDVKAYFILGGTMHDCAVSAWGIKGWYDYLRPISAIRMMADLGQCSDTNLPSYDPGGIPLVPGHIELVEAGDPLEGFMGFNVGKIKLYAWRGPAFIFDPDTDVAGVGWILAENWWPYQRPSFVTPPFAGYISGHSTFSRAASEIMTLLTGDEYFPGGMGEFPAPMNEFLVFEDGPSMDITLQWATYRDASDQTSLSRIWGGIHPPADDIPGRLIGKEIALEAFEKALCYFAGTAAPPEAYCRNVVLEPDGNGNYFIAPESIDDGSLDFCSAVTISVDPDFIPCAHGSYKQQVTLHVTDEDGNTSTCRATATLAQDADRDGFGDACDQCPGIDDRIDRNDDGLPDCAYFPGPGTAVPPEWGCGRQKVYVTYYFRGDVKQPRILCVSPNAARVLMRKGAYLGRPFSSIDANGSPGYGYMPADGRPIPEELQCDRGKLIVTYTSPEQPRKTYTFCVRPRVAQILMRYGAVLGKPDVH